jgi:hypothetical protein
MLYLQRLLLLLGVAPVLSYGALLDYVLSIRAYQRCTTAKINEMYDCQTACRLNRHMVPQELLLRMHLYCLQDSGCSAEIACWRVPCKA